MSGDSPAKIASTNSMKCVMRKDKQAWLKLFAEEACIEDPVGKSPLDETGLGHTGPKAIEGMCHSDKKKKKKYFQ